MTRILQDPRARTVVVVLLLLLTLGLAWHAVGMGGHGGMEMLGACLAVLVALGLVLSPPQAVIAGEPQQRRPPRLLPLVAQPSGGRHPPQEGTVLRH